MGARVLEMETDIIQMPREINVVSWVNERNNSMRRNSKAKQYIKKCKRKSAHDDFWCILSGISVFAIIFAAYFLLCMV